MKLLALTATLLAVSQAAVIGIDLGTELLKPGKKLEIVENVQSGRATPNLVAFTEEARLIGAEALSRASGKPEALVPFTLRLLGKLYNDTDVHTRMKAEFSPMELLETADRLTFSVRVREEIYSVEEVLSMIMEMARKMSDTFGHASIKDCVITVPPSFTRAQRILLMQVAQAAGLNPVALIHENAAAALYYGIDRLDNETAHHALFYNLGASRVQVSVVRYSAVERYIPGTGNKTLEHIEVLSHAWNDEIGGKLLDGVLAENIAAEFEKQQKIDVRTSKKAMLRVMNHANRVKKVLSANKVAYVHDDSLYQGKGMSYGVQREVLDGFVTERSTALLKPIEDALRLANLTMEQIDSLEVIGGVSRIPKVQELLKARNGNRDLGMHLNGDEAMAHGAALYAANFSHDLFVKPMWMSDVIPYTIRAEFWSPDDPLLAKNGTVFKTGVRVNSKKQLSFSFDKRVMCRLIAKYRDYDAILDEYEIADIQQVAANFSQTPVNVFTFGLDHNGLAFLWLVHSEVEVSIDTPAPSDANATDTTEESDTNSTETAETGSADTAGEGSADSAENTEAKNPLLTGKRTEKIKLKYASLPLELPTVLSKTDVENIAKKLVDFAVKEKERQKLAEAKSELEGFIYYLREKLDEEVYRQVTTEAERSELESLLDVERNWLEGDDFHKASSEELLKRKAAIRSTVFDALDREEEFRKRDEAVEDLQKRLDKMQETAQTLNDTMTWVPESMREAAFTAVKEAREWLETKLAEQKAKALWESPAFRTAELSKKADDVKVALDLVKRMPKPKPPVSFTQKKEPKKDEDKPTEAKPTEDKPTEDKQTDEKQTEDKPAEERPSEDQPNEESAQPEEPLELPEPNGDL